MVSRIIPMIAALTLGWADAAATQTPAVTVPFSRQYELRSKLNGREYRLFVSLPQVYSDGDTTRYPVFYVLDGNGYFALATETERLLRLRPDISEVIIVGVGYPVSSFRETSVMRWHDYTPSPDAQADSERAIQVGARSGGAEYHSGGAAAFVATLREEIIPFVEKSFRTTGDRGLFGDSLGGLLAAYVLFTSPELFSRYAMSSPTLWWNKGEIFALEASYAKTHRALGARVFLSVGGDETRERMIAPLDSLERTLRARGYEGLQITAHTFEGETHNSVAPAAMSRGLRFLYSLDAVKLASPSPASYAGLAETAALQGKYDEARSYLNQAIAASHTPLERLGYMRQIAGTYALQSGQVDALIKQLEAIASEAKAEGRNDIAAEAYGQIGATEATLGNADAAHRYLAMSKAVATGDTWWPHFYASAAHSRLKQWDPATSELSALESMAASHPEMSPDLIAIAKSIMLTEQGKHDEALKVLMTADTTNFVIMNRIAESHAALGDGADAMVWDKRILDNYNLTLEDVREANARRRAREQIAAARR